MATGLRIRVCRSSVGLAMLAMLTLTIPKPAIAAEKPPLQAASSIIVFDYAGGNAVPPPATVATSGAGPAGRAAPGVNPAPPPVIDDNPFNSLGVPSWALWRRDKKHPSGKRYSLKHGLGDGETFVVQVRNANAFKYQIGATVAGQNLFRTVPDALKNFGSPSIAAGAAAAGRNVPELKPEDAVRIIEEDIARIRGFGDQVRATILSVDTQQDRVAAIDTVQGALINIGERLFEDVALIGQIVRRKGPSGEDLGPTLPQANRLNITPGTVLVLTDQLLNFLPSLRTILQGQLSPGKPEIQQALTLAIQLEQQSAAVRVSTGQITDLVEAAVSKDYLVTNFGPFEVNNDVNTITVTILPLAGGATATASSGTTPSPAAGTSVVSVPARVVSVPTTKGFKIDFSAGLLVTQLVDKNFTTRPIRNTNPQQYRVREGSEDAFSFNAAAFTHFYWRTPGFVSGAGLSLGIAARNNPIYGIGASLFFGRNQRVVLTGGLAFGSVSRLNGVDVGDSISSTSVPTANRVRSAPFGAISYNY